MTFEAQLGRLVFLVACVVVWKGREVWLFTRNLSPVRAGVCMGCLAVAVLFMWTQNENPFLYFRF